jgi:hypothetical protein
MTVVTCLPRHSESVDGSELPEPKLQWLSLPMANGTVYLRMNPQFVDQLGADLSSSPLPFSRFPIEFSDQFDWANVGFGSAVALNTPSHRQFFGLEDLFHRVDAPVASHAAHAAIGVGGVVEKYEVGQFVNANPRDRLASLPTFVHRQQFGAGWMNGRQGRGSIDSDWTVAIDARRRGGDGSVCPLLHVDVAIAAVHLQFARVQFMAERDRLSWHVPGVERHRIGGSQKDCPGVSPPGQRE